MSVRGMHLMYPLLYACCAMQEVRERDLGGIRRWFSAQDPDEYTERVFHQAGVKYCIMTNVPFEPAEVQHWRPSVKPYSSRFRSALRYDLTSRVALLYQHKHMSICSLQRVP